MNEIKMNQIQKKNSMMWKQRLHQIMENSLGVLSITCLKWIWTPQSKQSLACLDYIFNQYICFSQEHQLQLMTLHVISTRIPLPKQKSVTHRHIPILQVVNKIISIRLTPRLFMGLSKVYVNQGSLLILRHQ